MPKSSAAKKAAVLGFAIGVLILFFTSSIRPVPSMSASGIHTMGGDSVPVADPLVVTGLSETVFSRRSSVLVDIAEVYALTGNLKSTEEVLLRVQPSSHRDIAIYTLVQRLKDKHGFFLPSSQKSIDKELDNERVLTQIKGLVTLVQNIHDPVLGSEMLCLVAELRSNLPPVEPGLPTVEELLLQSTTAAFKGDDSTSNGDSLFATAIEWSSKLWTITIPSLLAFCSYLAMKIFEATYEEVSSSISAKVGSKIAGIPLKIKRPSNE